MGKKDLTIDDIAKALGVSKTTVSRAMSGKGRISDETCRRVHEYVEQHGYKPNVIARGLAQSCTYNIAVVLPDDFCLTEIPFFMQCLAGIHEAAVAGGYDILMTMGDNHHLESMKNVITNKKADGIILMRTYVNDKAICYLQKEEVPFVVIGSHSDSRVIQVDQKHREACCELTCELLRRGFRRIALLGGDEYHIVTQDRYNGFQDAYKKMKKEISSDLVYFNLMEREKIEKIAAELVKSQIDCLLCMDDNICDIVLRKFQREHVEIPGQIAIASFFNSPMWENQKPSISSLVFDAHSQGREAGKAVISLIEHREIQDVNISAYKVKLGDSTAR